MYTLNEQKTAASALLTSISDTYTNRYTTDVGGSESSVQQNNQLQTQLNALEVKLAKVNTLSETYEREFLDRSAGKKIGGFFSSRGVNNLQDWVLLIFYTVYVLVSLGICGLALFASRTPLISVAMVISASLLIGVMMTAMILRFA
jgi:hypothetical protein